MEAHENACVCVCVRVRVCEKELKSLHGRLGLSEYLLAPKVMLNSTRHELYHAHKC